MKKQIPIVAGSVLLTGLGIYGVYLYASRVEARNWKLETVRITTYGAADRNGSPKAADTEKKFRILHLSDTHLAYPEAEKLRFLERVTDGDYDFVVLTGDIYENYSGLEYTKSLLSTRPKLGAYAVLGNHDYYNYSLFNKVFGRINRKLRHPLVYRDVEPMVEALHRHGWDVLRNESRTHAEGIHVVGIDYPGIKQDELADLVSQAPPDHLALTLFHMPRHLSYIERTGTHLALGGHTHGGQIRIPGFGALITDSELKRHEASGILQRGKTTFHISRGLSADPRTNFRLFCPPVATIIEVTHKPYAARPIESMANAVTTA